ncbi:MAG: hypothetical protein L3K26_05240 [Candidatus Hydrogenedentes bacterium]|nr:hypothetical protein [Candidatus Hydrogenedentota bacterium]
MICTRSKESRREGMSVSELFIVLGVTLVLSAILMPALASTNSDRAETILSAVATPILYDSAIRSTFGTSQPKRMGRRDSRRDRNATQATVADVNNVVNEAIVEARAMVGAKKLLTTDIRSRVP